MKKLYGYGVRYKAIYLAQQIVFQLFQLHHEEAVT